MNIKDIKPWLPLLVIIALMIVVFASGLHEKISLQVLQDNKEAMLNAVEAHPVVTALSFMAIYIVFVALSLPAATLLTLTGGFLFGTWLGIFYVVTAATIGATILFFIAKTSLGEVLRKKAGGLYTRVEGNMKDNAVGYLLFMRLVPIFPFFLVNIVPALFNVKARVFILTTFFGIIPGSFVFVNLGKQLATITDLGDLVSKQTLLAFLLLGLFALIPTIYKQIKGRNTALSVILAVCTFSSPTSEASNGNNRFLELYDGLLSEYVMPVTTNGIAYNGVNYDRWAVDPRHDEALKILLAENPDSFEDEEKKAFWINTYNFLTIDLIVSENERESIKNLGSFFTSPWKKHSWTLGESDYTLDDIEHKILRPMNDPRIHFAINCASLSCPDLGMESYQVDKLNKQLIEQVKLTLANKNKGLHETDGTLYVSKIFDWFSEDFDNGDVKGWLDKYQQINQHDELKFMDYDWSLNKVK
jgi:uncharacterized membrane protein YdjX (TVP38/TMEM64 family)